MVEGQTIQMEFYFHFLCHILEDYNMTDIADIKYVSSLLPDASLPKYSINVQIV